MGIVSGHVGCVVDGCALGAPWGSPRGPVGVNGNDEIGAGRGDLRSGRVVTSRARALEDRAGGCVRRDGREIAEAAGSWWRGSRPCTFRAAETVSYTRAAPTR